METVEKFVNKVEESGILSVDLETFYPEKEIIEFDLTPFLFMNLILKEKDFRQNLKSHDWEKYRDKNVALFCSADAIIPMWAYMLVVSYLNQCNAANVLFGDKTFVLKTLILKHIAEVDSSVYKDQKVVIKGCGEKYIPEAAYVEITRILMPVVRSIMYGEPCSTVPIYKKKII